MTRTHPIATAILTVLLVIPLAVPQCAAGLCDPDVACQMPEAPADDGDNLKLVGPSCCLAVSPSIGEREVATREALSKAGLAAPTAFWEPPAPLSTSPHPATRDATPARGGRANLALHRTLRL